VSPRNLVVIVADTLRDPGPLAPPGAPLMPYFEGLANEGLRLDRLFASSSWTAPSHVALLTGADPWETHFHMPGSGRRAPGRESLADKWRKGGGVSAAFSANFLVAPILGTATGYDRFNPGFRAGLAGVAQLAATQLGYERFLYDAFARSADPEAGVLARAWGGIASSVGTGLYKSINSMRSGDTLVRSLSHFLRQRARRQALPLHLFFNVAEAHEPYLIGQNGGGPGTRVTPGHLPSINFVRFTDVLSARTQTQDFIEAYRASCRTLDGLLQRMVELLRRHGVLDNATLVFLSDHGQNLGEHQFYGHGLYLYDELVKVPGVVWEFRGGKPVRLGPVPSEWIDHRHLFDLLATATPDGAELTPETTLNDSLLRRGPAASYYEGPGPRPPDGFVKKAPRPNPYRLLRLQQGGETAVVESDTKGGNLRDVGADSRDGLSPMLQEIARHILTSEVAAAQPSTADSAGMDAQVDARLKSWGYD
jgi:hypothetical protein